MSAPNKAAVYTYVRSLKNNRLTALGPVPKVGADCPTYQPFDL